jgi:hypothetical protein
MKRRYRCPVCGFPSLEEADPNGPLGLFLGTYEICFCCGTEFGFDIQMTTPEDVADQIRQRREEWIADGHKWWYSSIPPPPDWDWEEELRAIDTHVM